MGDAFGFLPPSQRKFPFPICFCRISECDRDHNSSFTALLLYSFLVQITACRPSLHLLPPDLLRPATEQIDVALFRWRKFFNFRQAAHRPTPLSYVSTICSAHNSWLKLAMCAVSTPRRLWCPLSGLMSLLTSLVK